MIKNSHPASLENPGVGWASLRAFNINMTLVRIVASVGWAFTLVGEAFDCLRLVADNPDLSVSVKSSVIVSL